MQGRQRCRATLAALLLLAGAALLCTAHAQAAAEPAAAQLEAHHHHGHHHHGRHGAGEPELTCEDVSDLDPEDDRCAFVRANCKAGGLVNYPVLYYCHVQRHGALARGALMLACAALLALLFRLISRASEDYFSCILSQISQDLGLPPRLGGVTLLALGNGAPDLSASIEAVKQGNYELALGALTGAGMFVGCVVAGRIITLSGGARARGAQIRDISTQFITVATVTGIVASGYFTYASVAALLSIYASYVVVVAVADFSHRMGVEWADVAKRVSRRWSSRFRVEMVAPLLREDHAAAAAAPGGGEGGDVEPALSQRGSSPLPALRPPDERRLSFAPAASVPAHVDARLAGAALARSPSPPQLPAAARRGFFGSLPDFLAHRQEPLPPPHLHSPSHTRHAPPVAHFQPHVAYSDLVNMSAKEYRQRALAEMAQSKSFYRRDIAASEDELSDLSEEEDEEEARYGGDRGSWAAAHPPPQHAHAQQLQQQQQQQQQQQPDEEWGGGQLYQPPVVSLDADALRHAAAARSAGGAETPESGHGEADAAAAAAAAAAAGKELAHLGSGSSRRSGPSVHSGSAGTRSFESTSLHRFSIASSQETAGAAAAAALAAVEEEAVAVEAWQGRQSPLQLAAGAAQWPFLRMLQCTVPLVEVNSYERQWFLVSLAASPLFIAAFLELLGNWKAWLVALGAGAAMSGAGFLGTLRLGGKAPLWSLGTGYPIGAALVAVYGFAVAAMWISTFASEIVGLLTFFGLLSKADPAVLGVTILAWGNSLMDYMNNTAMAARSRGGNSMAMTACFAGPLFNMLVGLGLGFWALLSQSHMRKAAVQMDPVVLVGCAFIMANCACLVAVALLHRQHLPAWCGWAMVGGYCAYLAVVLAVLAFG